MCLLQGLDQRRDSGTLLWQTLDRFATWQPSQGRAGVTACRQSHWARVRLRSWSTFVLNKLHISTKGCHDQVVFLFYLSGLFPLCFRSTSGLPMELKPNPSVSYTKVGSHFNPKIFIEGFFFYMTNKAVDRFSLTWRLSSRWWGWLHEHHPVPEERQVGEWQWVPGVVEHCHRRLRSGPLWGSAHGHLQWQSQSSKPGLPGWIWVRISW